VFEMMTGCLRLKQVPDLHSMGSDLSLRHWYGYIIVLMDTVVCCVVNA
jgi:hypothetical protein